MKKLLWFGLFLGGCLFGSDFVFEPIMIYVYEKGQEATAVGFIESISMAQNSYFLKHGAYSDALEKLSLGGQPITTNGVIDDYFVVVPIKATLAPPFNWSITLRRNQRETRPGSWKRYGAYSISFDSAKKTPLECDGGPIKGIDCKS